MGHNPHHYYSGQCPFHGHPRSLDRISVTEDSFSFAQIRKGVVVEAWSSGGHSLNELWGWLAWGVAIRRREGKEKLMFFWGQGASLDLKRVTRSNRGLLCSVWGAGISGQDFFLWAVVTLYYYW
ncbi:hypothetical protein CEXT_145611 [Caerostris extrusa]|uniref:Uncharacterized protein n=1 Tax=Caerostris extrusa TaxID=172846 RepID=A0AAV4UGJ2_CAEEX|nr:hypothetical protein CEXT_145611 [Caerostris extrusa]